MDLSLGQHVVIDRQLLVILYLTAFKTTLVTEYDREAHSHRNESGCTHTKSGKRRSKTVGLGRITIMD